MISPPCAPRRRILTCAPLFILVGVTGTLQAGDLAGDDDDDNLELVVVSASRTPIERRDVAGSMTVFTDEDLANRKPILVSDMLRNAPGVAVSRSGGMGGITQVRVRGAEANQVLVLIDGVEANNVSDGGYNFANLLANDVAQIEVLRGPQSSLWGSGALAGVISITTERSETPFGINAFLEGGSFNTVNTGINLGGVVDRFHYRVSASYLDTDGENISLEGGEEDGHQNKTAQLNLGYDFTDNINLKGFYRLTEARTDFDDTFSGPPMDADKRTESDFDYSAVIFQVAAFDRVWLNDIGAKMNRGDEDSYTDGSLDNNVKTSKLRGYWQSTWLPAGGDNNSLTLVAERVRETFEQEGFSASDHSQAMTGYVGEYMHNWNSGLKLSLSARRDDNEEFKDANTYRVGLLFDRLDRGWLLRTAYGTGVKNPTLVELFGTFDNFVGNSDLKPEQSVSWEVGTTLKTPNNFFKFDLTYFEERLEDEIDGFYYDVAQGAFTAVNTDGESDRSGVEVSGLFNFTGQLSLYLAYTYLDAREPEGDDGASEIEIRRPRHTAAANLNYRFLDDRGRVNLNVDYTGGQADIDFSPPTYNTEVCLDAFTLVSLVASFEVIDKLEVYVRGENLLDEEYQEVFGYAGNSRAGYLGLRYAWSL